MKVARTQARRRFSVLRAVLVGVLALAGFASVIGSNAACGGSGGGGGGTGGGPTCTDAKGCFDYTCYKEGATRSFKTDVLPIFEQSCSLSMSCHGNPQSPKTGAGYQPYLGEVDETKPADTAKIIALIVGQKSPSATNENIVEAGSPEKSYLMQKMDGDVKCGVAMCVKDDCGKTMPQGSFPLPQTTRDVIRDWIKQGAQDN